MAERGASNPRKRFQNRVKTFGDGIGPDLLLRLTHPPALGPWQGCTRGTCWPQGAKRDGIAAAQPPNLQLRGPQPAEPTRLRPNQPGSSFHFWAQVKRSAWFRFAQWLPTGSARQPIIVEPFTLTGRDGRAGRVG